ncbi:hypothetical protein LINPERHAP1_LOCUS17459, partial [Linum perenne]
QHLDSKYPGTRIAISSSRRHEPVATNGSSIGALQLPESKIEAKGIFGSSNTGFGEGKGRKE